MTMTMERKQYIKPDTEVVEIELSKILCNSIPDDFWGYAPGQNPADTEKLA